MTFFRVVFRKSFVFINFLFILISPAILRGQARPRVLQAVDNAQRVTLKGNVHPLAASTNDRGAISDAQPIGRILLLLRRSDEQQAALSSFMEQQQDKSSPNYQHWLGPSEFGAQYGVADQDIQAVTQWLTQQGFQINRVYSSKLEIEFSGNAAQVRAAFGTDLRNFQVGGKTYVANSADPQIPAALAPVIAGIVSLNNFPRQSYVRRLGQFRREKGQSLAKPLFTFPLFSANNFYGIGPGDFATIYNSAPLIAAANDGTGQTIAIVGETNINLQDVQNFRQIFGLPNTFTAANIILNGEDPGITSTDEESEADLDVQWSGAVAPGATVQFVVSASTPASAGIDLSALYIIEHNQASAMSESYGACELSLGTAGNAFYNSLWEQAASQGITVALSAGDGGSAGCDDFNSEATASDGLAVSGFSSTPFNVSVGGTDFDQMNTQSTYWNPTNNPTTGVSVKGYIPEIPWNESCAQLGLSGCSSPQGQQYQDIVAGSGGPSLRHSKPPWQMGITSMPNDSSRDQPDISLFASPGFNGSGYIVCQQDVSGSGQACDLNNGLEDFSIIGGTSASSPAFAGVMALVNQYEAAHGGSPRQGNANYTLYALARKAGASCTSAVTEAAGCIFNDVTHGNSGFTASVGTNSVPCQAGTPSCSAITGAGVGVLEDPTKNEAWLAGAGYDMATGLGSLNVQNLAQNWASVSTVATTTALTLTPTTGIIHGIAENVGVSITVTPASGTATGVVSLVANMPDGSTRGVDNFSLLNGATSGTKTQNLPGGSYTVTAHYAGDGTNAPSDSTPVSVTVAPETSQTFVVVPSFTPGGAQISGNASLVTYGSSYIIRMYVTDKTGVANPAGAPTSICDQTNLLACPTGSVTLLSSGSPVDGGTFALNNAGYTRDIAPTLQGGTYSLVATYSGDSSFNASTSAAHTLTVTPVSTQISGPFTNNPFPGPVLIGTPTVLSVVVNTSVYGVGPGGTVTFYDGSAALPGTVSLTSTSGTTNQYANLNASLSVNFTTTGPHVITAKYSGDANYAASVSDASTLNLFYQTSTSEVVPSTAINYGQSVTVSATVLSPNKSPAMTGKILFYPYSNSSGSQPGSTPTAGTDANGNQTLTATFTYTPSGPDEILSIYAGDQNYEPSQSNLQSINVNIPDFSVPPTLSLVVTAGQTGTAMFQITPASNTPSPVTFATLNVPFPGANLSISPSPANLGGSPVPVTVNVSTVGPTTPAQTASQMRIKRSAFLYLPRGGWLSTAVVSGVVIVFLLGLPGRRRNYRAAFFAGIVCAISLSVGCGGGGGSLSGSEGGAPPGGTPTLTATTTTLSTSSTKLPVGTNYDVMATVASSEQKVPNGTVTFYLNGNAISLPTPLVNGAAIFEGAGAFGVGSFTYTAQYSGDSSNASSQSSSPLTVVETGSVTQQLYAQTGTLSHLMEVTITLQ
jgi:subtilase family serine protease